jgi:hypothetical protein
MFDHTPIGGPLQRGEFVTFIEDILTGRYCTESTFTLPVTAIERRCSDCGAPVEPIELPDGHEYDAEIFVDENGETRVDLLHPHVCGKTSGPDRHGILKYGDLWSTE